MATRHFLVISSSEKVGQTSWERRHPCLLTSVSRSSPETSQARMSALPGSLPYTRAAIFILSQRRKLLMLFNYDQLVIRQLRDREFGISMIHSDRQTARRAQRLRSLESAGDLNPDAAHGNRREIARLRVDAQIDQVQQCAPPLAH